MKNLIKRLVGYLAKKSGATETLENAQRMIGEQQTTTLNSIGALRSVILKNEACPRVEKMPYPGYSCTQLVAEDYTIGYSFNLLNNAYSFCKVARKKGVDARLFLDPKFADIFVTSLPQWEEIDFHGAEMPHNTDQLPPWDLPDFVQSAQWDVANFDKVSLNFEYEKMQEIFRETAIDLKPQDAFSYLLAYSVLPHLDLLRLYKTVDILQVSGSHIGVASFTNKPYVTFPFGGDLMISPFEDNEFGWLHARGFRKAHRHIVSGEIMMEYMEALGIPRQKIDLLPFMIDTDVYAPRPDDSLREQLKKEYPGKIIFFVGARQNWFWKGSDKLWKAIAKVKQKTDTAVFITVWYGQDMERSDELIKTLGIEYSVHKVGVFSKGALRRYINAVDVCIDQFTHGGLGTFALEAMSCAKPLVTYYARDKHFHFEQDPPVANAFSEDEIAEHILYCVEKASSLPQWGQQHREWIKRYHSHEALWPAYDKVYRKTLMTSKIS